MRGPRTSSNYSEESFSFCASSGLMSAGILRGLRREPVFMKMLIPAPARLVAVIATSTPVINLNTLSPVDAAAGIVRKTRSCSKRVGSRCGSCARGEGVTTWDCVCGRQHTISSRRKRLLPLSCWVVKQAFSSAVLCKN